MGRKVDRGRRREDEKTRKRIEGRHDLLSLTKRRKEQKLFFPQSVPYRRHPISRRTHRRSRSSFDRFRRHVTAILSFLLLLSSLLLHTTSESMSETMSDWKTMNHRNLGGLGRQAAGRHDVWGRYDGEHDGPTPPTNQRVHATLSFSSFLARAGNAEQRLGIILRALFMDLSNHYHDRNN